MWRVFPFIAVSLLGCAGSKPAEKIADADLTEERLTCEDFLERDELKYEDDFAMTMIPGEIKCPCVDAVICDDIIYCSAFQCPGWESVYFHK